MEMEVQPTAGVAVARAATRHDGADSDADGDD